jgi:protease II
MAARYPVLAGAWGDVRYDDYAWMRDDSRSNETVLSYLGRVSTSLSSLVMHFIFACDHLTATLPG